MFIFSRNRPRYLKRQLEMWLPQGPRILIGDGSDVPSPEVREIANDEANVSYLHHPSAAARWSWAADRANSEFFLVMTDDDITLPSGVLACIEKLRQKKELGSCMGQVLCWSLTQPDHDMLFQPRYDALLNLEIPTISNDNYQGQYMHILEVPTWYSVQRSSIAKSVLTLLSSISAIEEGQPRFQHSFIYECSHQIASAMLGGIGTVPNLMWLRSLENISVRELEGGLVNQQDLLDRHLEDPASSTWLKEIAKVELFSDLFGGPTEVVDAFTIGAQYFISGSRDHAPIGAKIRAQILNFAYRWQIAVKTILRISILRSIREKIRRKEFFEIGEMDNLGSQDTIIVLGRVVNVLELNQIKTLLKQFYSVPSKY